MLIAYRIMEELTDFLLTTDFSLEAHYALIF